MNGTHKTIAISLLATFVIAILAIQIGFAYQASIENSGNNMSVNHKEIMVLDDSGDPLCVQLPEVSYSGSYNEWTVGYYDPHISGNIALKFPGNVANIRAWFEMESIESYAAVEKITLRFQNVDYVLFNQQTQSLTVTNQSNPAVIEVSKANAADPLDFIIFVSYVETLNFNPNLIDNFMVSKVKFVMDTQDPLPE